MKTIRIIFVFALGLVVGAMVAPSLSPMSGQSTAKAVDVKTQETVTLTPDGKTVKQGKPESEKPLANVAIRVEREEKGLVTGTLVAKVDGKWVPVILSSFSAQAK